MELQRHAFLASALDGYIEFTLRDPLDRSQCGYGGEEKNPKIFHETNHSNPARSQPLY
jgi:hypothetical protein